MSSYIITRAGPNFADTAKNRIRGLTKGAKVKFEGDAAELKIGGLTLDNANLVITLASNSKVVIGKNVRLAGNVAISAKANSVLLIGDNCEIADTKLACHSGAKLELGSDCKINRNGIFSSERGALLRLGRACTFRMNAFVVAHKHTQIVLGDECMAAANVHIRSSDGHSIFDLKSKTKINALSLVREVIVGNHVWFGYDSMVMYGTNPGNDSIVGAKSLVKGSFPANSLIVGVPAKLLRKNMSWHRSDAISFADFSASDERRQLGDATDRTERAWAEPAYREPRIVELGLDETNAPESLTRGEGKSAVESSRRQTVFAKALTQSIPVFLDDRHRKKFVNQPHAFFADSKRPIVHLLGRLVMRPSEKRAEARWLSGKR